MLMTEDPRIAFVVEKKQNTPKRDVMRWYTVIGGRGMVRIF
jgi:hypothetical protein